MGVRTWGNSRNGSAVMLTGTYLMRGEISQRLLGALPACSGCGVRYLPSVASPPLH